MKKMKLYSLLLCVCALLSYGNAWSQTPTKGLQFNGINQYMTIASHADFNFTNAESYSVFAWVNTEGTAYTQLVSTRQGGDGYDFAQQSNKLINDFANPYLRTEQSTADFTSNTWHHVGFVYDGANDKITLYQNGVAVKEGTTTTQANTFGNYITVFAKAGNKTIIPAAGHTKGKIATLRFYKKALTASEITTDKDNASAAIANPDLKAAYDFNAPLVSSGDKYIVNDIKGGHPGTLYNFTGLAFNGTNQYMTIDPHTDFDFTNTGSFSVSAWVNTVNNSYSQFVSTRQGGDGYDFAQDGTTANKKLTHDFGTPYLRTQQADANFTPYTWHHVAFVYDGSAKTMTLYQNGAAVGLATTATYHPQTAISTQANTFGNYITVFAKAGNKTITAAGNYTKGSISTLRFFRRALTATEIVADKDAEVTAGSADPDLVAAYDFSVRLQDGSNLIVPNILGSNHPGILRNFTDDVLTMATPLNKNNNLIQIYPNPAKDAIHLNNEADKAMVYSLTGKLLIEKTGKITSLDVSGLAKGVYLIKLEVNNLGYSTQKLIKE